jgi:hypothetical protein
VLVLRFGAVNHSAEVLVNGRPVGRHDGGWTPFELPLDRHLLHDVDNLLEVVVSYPPLLAADTGAVSLQEIPHGKQTWYGTNAGIWQPVELEHRPRQHVAGAHIRPEAVTGRVAARVTLAEPAAPGAQVHLLVLARDAGGQTGQVVGHAIGTPHGRLIELQVAVTDPRLWSPDAPWLYDAVVEVRHDDELVDAVTVTTGFRSVATRDGVVLLNGEPIEVRGVLDQDYHRGDELRARRTEDLERTFADVKRLGFNLVRCHIKRPDPAYFDTADRLGLLVWAELPSWQRFTPRSAAAAESLLDEMVDTDGHHPSIVIWTVVNEGWGVDLRDPEQRAWMARTSAGPRRSPPARWWWTTPPARPTSTCTPTSTTSTSTAACPSAGPAGTSGSTSSSTGRPGASPRTATRSAPARSRWSSRSSATGACPTSPRWPGRTASTRGGPPPAATGPSARPRPPTPVGRFYKHRLDQVFGSWQGFVEATQRQQLLGTRYQIGSLRRRPQIAGYVLTQLSDVQWEANGLFDMDRRPADVRRRFA